jgi:hypothetical protein
MQVSSVDEELSLRVAELDVSPSVDAHERRAADVAPTSALESLDDVAFLGEYPYSVANQHSSLNVVVDERRQWALGRVQRNP